MHSQEILVIINTLSGKNKNRSFIIDEIKKSIASEILVIKSKADFINALEIANNEKFKYVVINGGDGTINSFLPVIIEQNKVLGILPSGSGNGLARTLGISLNPLKALQSIHYGVVDFIDVGKIIIYGKDSVMEKYFTCAVGCGIDADIAGRFEKQKIRGLSGYILAGIKEFFCHKPVYAKVTFDDTEFSDDFLILSVMNIPQYGNDFYLIPSAKINDGLLNIALLKKINGFKYPVVFWNILRRKERKPMRYFTCKEIRIELKARTHKYIHIDGEPLQVSQNAIIEISVIKKGLKILRDKGG